MDCARAAGEARTEVRMLKNCTVSATLPFRGLKSARDFYTKKVGLEFVEGSPELGYLEFAAGGGTLLQVFESKSRKSKDTAATFEVEDLAREMSALRRRGVVFEEYDLPGIKTVDGVATMDGPMTGHRGAWFTDPGGNVIALHEAPRRARSSATTCARKGSTRRRRA